MKKAGLKTLSGEVDANYRTARLIKPTSKPSGWPGKFPTGLSHQFRFCWIDTRNSANYHCASDSKPPQTMNSHHRGLAHAPAQDIDRRAQRSGAGHTASCSMCKAHGFRWSIAIRRSSWIYTTPSSRIIKPRRNAFFDRLTCLHE